MSDSTVITRPPAPLARLIVPRRCVEWTLEVMRAAGDREMVAYWVGDALSSGNTGAVMTVVYPSVYAGYSSFRVAEGQMGRIAQWCSTRNLWVLAQIHTHPNDEPHSDVDECWPLSHRPGFVSIVIPYFARRSTPEDPLWHVHERMTKRWSEIDPQQRIDVIPDLWTPEA